MDVKLVVVGGDAKATEVKLKLPAVIGRGREATLTLPHPLVSRKHCEIFESDGYLVVRDMGSLNGTFINNERITEAVLPPGELLTLGTVTFRAAYQPSAAGPPDSAAAAAAPQDLEIGLAPDDEEPLEVEEVVEVMEEGEVADFGDFEIVEIDEDDQQTGVSELDTLEPE